MIQVIEGLPDGVVGLDAVGEVKSAEREQAEVWASEGLDASGWTERQPK